MTLPLLGPPTARDQQIPWPSRGCKTRAWRARPQLRHRHHVACQAAARTRRRKRDKARKAQVGKTSVWYARPNLNEAPRLAALQKVAALAVSRPLPAQPRFFCAARGHPISASYNGSQARSIACEPLIPHSWNSGGGCRVSHNHPDLVACPARGRGCRWRHEAAHRVGAMKAPPLVAAWCHSAAYDTPSEAALRRDGSRGRGGLTRAALARLSENQSKRKPRAGDGARAWRFNPVPSPA
jgi:hypothetical protein